MKEESFVLLSLDEDKAQDYAEVIRNPTCRKILDMLSKKDHTETDLSKALTLPLSTVHYNMKNLVKTGLVQVDEFHYSTRGKEVNHYSLANKLIIIAPQKKDRLKERLMKFLPIAGIAAVGTLVLYASTRGMMKAGVAQTADAQLLMAETSAKVAAPMAATPPAVDPTSSIMWFVGGLAAMFVLFLAYELLFAKRK